MTYRTLPAPEISQATLQNLITALESSLEKEFNIVVINVNTLTEQEQFAKLRLIAEVAQSVWG